MNVVVAGISSPRADSLPTTPAPVVEERLARQMEALGAVRILVVCLVQMAVLERLVSQDSLGTLAERAS